MKNYEEIKKRIEDSFEKLKQDLGEILKNISPEQLQKELEELGAEFEDLNPDTKDESVLPG